MIRVISGKMSHRWKEGTVGRRIKTAWFSQYRAASAELPSALANGERRGEVLLRHTQGAGVKESTFARMMKAGRALDSLMPELQVEQVRCTYMQADFLGKIAQISTVRAQALLDTVLNNNCTIEQLKTALIELQQTQPETASLHNRDSTRRLVLAHERYCAEAVARSGAVFFGAPSGSILRQIGSTQYQAPNFVVTQGEEIQAAIFTRVGGISKSAMAVSLEFLQLAIAHHALVPRVWYLLPKDSPVVAPLTRLATMVGGAPHQKGWLSIATLDPENGSLEVQSDDAYLAQASLSIFESDLSEFRWTGRDVATGEEMSLNYFRALADG
ncbi:hypothetical protein ACLUTX_29615 [Enterobacterales bacterium AE_CKDN230030158-1A_HGKHYDSX7]